MNTRKSTNSLSNDDFKAIIAADAKATGLGLPFNVLISFHPRTTREMTLKERLAEFKRIRDNYCQFGRQNRFERAWLYVREVARKRWRSTCTCFAMCRRNCARN